MDTVPFRQVALFPPSVFPWKAYPFEDAKPPVSPTPFAVCFESQCLHEWPAMAAEGRGKDSHFRTSTPNIRRHVPPCGWRGTVSSDPSDTEATITEPAEPESVQEQSPLFFAHCLQSHLCDHFPPPFQWDLAQSSKFWGKPDDKILFRAETSFFSAINMSDPCDISAPNAWEVQVPLRADPCQPHAGESEMGSKWWSIQPPPRPALLPPFPLRAALSVSRGGLERENRPGVEGFAYWHAVVGTWDRWVTAASRAAHGGPLATTFQGATLWPCPRSAFNSEGKGLVPSRLPLLSLEALLVWVFFRMTPSLPGAPPSWVAGFSPSRRKGRHSCFLLSHSISCREDISPLVFARMGDSWFFCSLQP